MGNSFGSTSAQNADWTRLVQQQQNYIGSSMANAFYVDYSTALHTKCKHGKIIPAFMLRDCSDQPLDHFLSHERIKIELKRWHGDLKC